jgi:hypothetical protein
MYFKSFPYTYYTLDNTNTVQVVTNITNRATLSDEVKQNLGLFDEYDIKDGETPELVADKFYGNPQLHWLVLHYNDIVDPRFEWPLPTNSFENYARGKYTDINGIHHYEDANTNYTNGQLYITSAAAFGILNVNDVILNSNSAGTAYVTGKNSNSNVRVTVTVGGIKTGDQIRLAANVDAGSATVTGVTVLSGTPVTNLEFEELVNESKRRIKILKSNYVDAVVNDFKKKLGE